MISLKDQWRIASLVMLTHRVSRKTASEERWRSLFMLQIKTHALHTLLRKKDKASLKQWHQAINTLETQVPNGLSELANEVDRCRGFFSPPSLLTPTPRDILADLDQLDEEFDGLTFENGKLSVETEPIVLVGIPLGRFRVVVNLSELDGLSEQFLRVVALDPNTAYSDSSVTHPHVSNERLCLGDGAYYINQAVREGRLADLFIMLRSILGNYNEESPYVALCDWYGRSCWDCGEMVNEEDGCSCADCGEFLCDGCVMYCSCCDDPYCSRCIRSCEQCDRNLCEACLSTCPDCETTLCTSCLEDGCENCKENEHDDNVNPTQTNPVESSAGAPAV